MPTKRKPYTAKSLTGATAYVRLLLKQREEWNATLGRYMKEVNMLAKLAAKGPAFFNPLEAMAAEQLRDRILRELNMNSDGTFIKRDWHEHNRPPLPHRRS
jgi:hypothetical protein